MIEKRFHTMTITLENVNQVQAIALKKMFEYMQYLGNIDSSRMCSFFADGDGDFRPKVIIDYPETLPEVPEITGIITFDDIDSARRSNNSVILTCSGDFAIDFDEIAWKIYHDK